MTTTENSRRKDDARPAETLHWDAACSICAGAGTTFGKTCVCRAPEAKRLTLTDALRQAARDLLEHTAAAGTCITIPGEPRLYVLVGAASAIGKLLPDSAVVQPGQVSGNSGELGARAERPAVPDILFDGKAVYDEIVREIGKTYCGNPGVVSDTLDAIVRLMRRAAPVAQQGEQITATRIPPAVRVAGAKMANTMFNLAQRPGEPIDSDLVASMDKMRREWDAAISGTKGAAS